MGVKLRERPGKGWYVLTDWNGQRKAKCFGKDKKLAKAFAEKLASKLKWAEQSGEPIALSRSDATMPTVKDYLLEWLRVYAEAHCKPSTAAEYRKSVRGYLIPRFGERRLHEVSRTDIKRFIAFLLECRKRRTIHNILTPLKEAYHHAIDDGLVTVNPVSNMGRWMADREGADSHIDPLTSLEVRAMLASAKEKYRLFHPLFLCAVRTGMRQGELIGLQWGDVDFHGGFIEVRRAVVRRQITTTKTHKIRRVEMSPQLAGILKALKETRHLDAAMKGQPMSERIFLGVTGKRLNDDLLRKAFYGCLEAAELRRVRFHDLRHTYASLLIQRGANPKYIQEQLGHVSISITLDIYSHLFRGDHQHHVYSLDDPQELIGFSSVSEGESATQAQPADWETPDQNLKVLDVL
jgi:integrase